MQYQAVSVECDGKGWAQEKRVRNTRTWIKSVEFRPFALHTDLFQWGSGFRFSRFFRSPLSYLPQTHLSFSPLPSPLGKGCVWKVWTQDTDKFDEEFKSLATAWWRGGRQAVAKGGTWTLSAIKFRVLSRGGWGSEATSERELGLEFTYEIEQRRKK